MCIRDSPRSQARILSGIKSFFHFLVMADYREDDPSELLEGPKIGFKLPEVLTVEEIDTIISTVDMSKKEGQRNRAILETLYSCGLRVSELCNLKLSELYFDEMCIRDRDRPAVYRWFTLRLHTPIKAGEMCIRDRCQHASENLYALKQTHKYQLAMQ